MIEKIDNSQPLIESGASPKQPNSANAPASNGADVSIQVDYGSFIDKAMQIQQTDARAVQRARELLLSGRLESTENIRAAAENIIKFGI